MPKLSIIIPCYYNEDNIPVTGQKLLDNEASFPAGTDIEYVFVDDGSKDKTMQSLLAFKEKCPDRVRIVKLAANVGSYNAIVAGMEYATGDCCTVISADLQDPPELIPKMYDYWLKGIKFVVASRTDREEPFFSKAFSNFYHFMIKKLALSNVPKGGFDFVLFDSLLKNELLKMKEKDTNSLYLLAWMNFEMVNIPYKRAKREIGKSRWTLKKKIKLFIDSFVSFSFFPLRLITVLGFIIGFVALIYSGIIIAQKINGKIPVSGWSSMMLIVLLTSSFQMIAIGILGEYLWRVLEASRKRPLYIVEKVYE